MKKRHRRMLATIALGASIVFSIGLYASSTRIKALTTKIEEEVREEQKMLKEEQARLVELQEEVAQMDTTQYIEKVASEQLGMVKEDTIIIREKP